MILAMILPTRSRLPGLKGRSRTRDWSGLRIVDVRLTWIDIDCVCALNRDTAWVRLLLDGDRFLKTRQDVLRQSHFRQRKQEGQRRFSSLVPVDTIDMQPIAAAACLRRVEFQSEIVPADEPVKGALRVLVPAEVRCGAISFETGRNCCLRFNGLLVEIGTRAATAVEPIAA